MVSFIITHSAEFTKDLTEEVWAVVDGKMTPSGHNWVSGQGTGPRLDKKEGDGEGVDEFGNKVEDGEEEEADVQRGAQEAQGSDKRLQEGRGCAFLTRSNG